MRPLFIIMIFMRPYTRTFVTLGDFKNVVTFGNNDLVIKLRNVQHKNSKYPIGPSNNNALTIN